MSCAGFTEALSVDYALGSAAIASSSEGGYVAANAVDGNDNAPSRWASLFNNDESLTLDLGAVRPLCEARLKWEAAHAATYELQRLDEVSGNWTTLVAVTGIEGWQAVPLGLPDGTRARHVRMQGLTRATPYGYSLFSFELLGPILPPAPPSPPAPPPVAGTSAAPAPPPCAVSAWPVASVCPEPVVRASNAHSVGAGRASKRPLGAALSCIGAR